MDGIITAGEGAQTSFNILDVAFQAGNGLGERFCQDSGFIITF